MRHAAPLLFLVSSMLVACGSSDGGDPGKQTPPNNTPSESDPCGLNSGWQGDELCVPPPAAGEGIQLHVGPANYRDPAAVAPYVINGGEEDVRCFIARIPEGGFYYLRQQNRMRPGSHHMLINLVPDDGRPAGPAAGCEISSLGSIPGSQMPKRDVPNELGVEDAGLARYLPAGTLAAFQLHYVNTGKTPMLREAWVNLYRLDDATVKQRLQSVFLVADLALNIPPKTRQTVTNAFTPALTERTRLFTLNAHMHAHAESFTVWHLHGDERNLVYQSFDWAEPDELTYNSVVQNAPPDPAAKRDGGVSGALYLEPGDSLEWSCDVNNTLDTPIRFANEAYTAEMCLLSGAYVSETPGLLAAGCAAGQCSTRLPR